MQTGKNAPAQTETGSAVLKAVIGEGGGEEGRESRGREQEAV